MKKLRPLSALKSWEQVLPGAVDMEQHRAEIKVDALPKGAYILVASSTGKPGNEDKNNIVTAVRFQVSSLSMVGNNGSTEGYILTAKSGVALPNVKALFWSRKWNNKKRIYEFQKLGAASSDAKGVLRLPSDEAADYENRLSAVTLISGEDTLQVGGYFNVYNGQNDPPATHATTFFFTDRAIYRPGQTIYFKGIVLNSSDYGRRNEIIAGRKTTVEFYDANGQKIQSQMVTTNEFGSYTGTFTAPEGLLGGQMSIRDADHTGQADFSVEEYKRPKFFVEFDSLKGSYALNQEVNIKVFAKAYAGNNIDGAAVKYRVVRRAEVPILLVLLPLGHALITRNGNCQWYGGNWCGWFF